MTRVQKAIFPGFIVGCMALVLFVSLVASPHVALASNPLPVATVAPTVEAAVEPEAQEAQVASEQPVAETLAEAQEPAPAEEAASSDGACSVRSGFPDSVRQWCDLIDRYAGENQVDPNLIAAMMLQESGGNPQAYSKSGAVGLLQVMPRDGLASSFMCINGPCFASRPSSQELYDPEFNISYGTNMLAGLIQKHGSVRDALKSYGPMNVGYYYADIVLGILNRY